MFTPILVRNNQRAAEKAVANGGGGTSLGECLQLRTKKSLYFCEESANFHRNAHVTRHFAQEFQFCTHFAATNGSARDTRKY